MLGRDKLDNNLLICDRGNFNQITAWSRNRTLVTEVFKLYTSFQMEYCALLSNLPLQLYLKILKNQFINNLWKISITGFKITDLC